MCVWRNKRFRFLLESQDPVSYSWFRRMAVPSLHVDVVFTPTVVVVVLSPAVHRVGLGAGRRTASARRGSVMADGFPRCRRDKGSLAQAAIHLGFLRASSPAPEP